MYCLLAEFTTPRQLKRAARRTRAAGYRLVDGYSAVPVPGLAGKLGFDEERVHRLSLAGAIVGAAAMLFVQWWTATVDYPLNVGGRPLAAWPAFLFPAFEVGTLWAALAATIAMLAMNRLPRRDHPLLRFEPFTRGAGDRFFLAVSATDPRFDPAATRAFLEALAPAAVWEVPP